MTDPRKNNTVTIQSVPSATDTRQRVIVTMTALESGRKRDVAPQPSATTERRIHK